MQYFYSKCVTFKMCWWNYRDVEIWNGFDRTLRNWTMCRSSVTHSLLSGASRISLLTMEILPKKGAELFIKLETLPCNLISILGCHLSQNLATLSAFKYRRKAHQEVSRHSYVLAMITNERGWYNLNKTRLLPLSSVTVASAFLCWYLFNFPPQSICMSFHVGLLLRVSSKMIRFTVKTLGFLDWQGGY